MTTKTPDYNLVIEALLEGQSIDPIERAQLMSRLDAEEAFAIPLDDVHLLGDGTKQRHTPISLGNHAGQAVQDLMATFCMEGRQPATWGELKGLLAALQRLHIWSVAFDQSDASRQALDKEVAEMWPELLAPLNAYREGDPIFLASYWRMVFTMEAFSQHWDPDCGWLGMPDIRKMRSNLA